jgi:hypothetical protein
MNKLRGASSRLKEKDDEKMKGLEFLCPTAHLPLNGDKGYGI